MNIPPETYLRVPADALRDLAVRLGVAAGLPSERADLLADLLTANDLRGVISHGTGRLATYVRLLRDSTLNPDPRLEVVRESQPVCWSTETVAWATSLPTKGPSC